MGLGCFLWKQEPFQLALNVSQLNCLGFPGCGWLRSGSISQYCVEVHSALAVPHTEASRQPMTPKITFRPPSWTTLYETEFRCMPRRNETYVHTETCKQISPAIVFKVTQSENNSNVHQQINQREGERKEVILYSLMVLFTYNVHRNKTYVVCFAGLGQEKLGSDC